MSPIFLRGVRLKVYDCFTFCNEFELLKLRLRALWNVVDCFVIVEADKTHTNNPKPFYFWERQDDFREFFPKIRHVPVEMNVPFGGVGDWSIEHAQRDAIAYGLSDAAPDDLIMIGDADEILAPDVFARLNDEMKLTAPVVTVNAPKGSVTCPARLLVSASEFLNRGAIVMAQSRHSCYFDLVHPEPWCGTVLAKRKNLTTPQALRDLRNDLPRFPDGGYHFTYMGGVERIIDKMTSIVDGNEYVVHSGGRLIDRAYVTEAMTNGKDLYGRRRGQVYRAYDAHNIRLPYVDEFLTEHPNFLREPEKYFGGKNFS